MFEFLFSRFKEALQFKKSKELNGPEIYKLTWTDCLGSHDSALVFEVFTPTAFEFKFSEVTGIITSQHLKLYHQGSEPYQMSFEATRVKVNLNNKVKS
ncbi:hypothetical protein A2767_03205 [Candidatus Roizmanbacteria bacterium RIFCSPHIGHO2_01_FULL_35_10]|uniref:Uncharacterized protein n=1 Tax=Candidatus Roizmanbacteria bacterium RIFCSPLOWO2_01_FULL_35_13 TaxID=1802055 RepID=A0A1F7IH95_9BACT|nr:MAG: hypothetical protein A2767_03205 [Candidatus Roizmanbacteria bacterium RIFCSPHIGHO2_01_FULL_35_10]OGK42703.1 MAG: hypothetical protein A3A74_00150 [Candidatus Roizmanbacteria bacterium RIFCSPLOWO2_01_FULL_35_13]